MQLLEAETTNLSLSNYSRLMAVAIPEKLWTMQNLEPQAADGSLVFRILESLMYIIPQRPLGDLVIPIMDPELLTTDNKDRVFPFPNSWDFLESQAPNGCVESPIMDPWDCEALTADGGLVSPTVNSWFKPQTAYGCPVSQYEYSGAHMAFKAYYGFAMMPHCFGSFVTERGSYIPFPEPVKNYETRGGAGHLVGPISNYGNHMVDSGFRVVMPGHLGVPISNYGNHMVNQVDKDQEATKFRFKDGILTLLMVTMILTFMSALTSASIENPHQASIATRSFLWCNSAAFVASLAGVIHLLHEFPLKPWSHITLSVLFIPYMLFVLKISPDDACPLLLLSIPILLFAAARELCGFTD